MAGLSGRTLGGFVPREPIGEGDYSVVYRCEQPLLKRDAVIKVLHERRRRNDLARERFLREARLASRLKHPDAAHVCAFGVEQDDGPLWIAMELVEGITRTGEDSFACVLPQSSSGAAVTSDARRRSRRPPCRALHVDRAARAPGAAR